MAPAQSDVALWIGLAILGCCSAFAIHKNLTLVRTTSEVAYVPSPSSNKVNKQTQDAIKVSTLCALLQSTSSEVRDAATKIVAERALQSPAIWRMLRRQLRSKSDPKARDQALCMIVQFGPGSPYDLRLWRRDESRYIERDEFFQPATFSACVACLCNMLPAAHQAERLHQHHDSAEADALWFAQKLLEKDVSLALKAGLVRKWLANYPLNVRTPEKSKKEVMREMTKAYEYGDDYERLLCCVLHDLMEEAEARAEMRACGLGDPGAARELRRQYALTWGSRHHYTPSASERRFPCAEDHTRDVDDYMADVWPMDMILAFRGRGGDASEVHGQEPLAHVTGDTDSEPDDDVDVNGLASLWSPNERGVRRREESEEERALRSRRREAMVFAEGGGPIRREDIIESRREEIVDEEVEEELEQLIEEMGEEPDLD